MSLNARPFSTVGTYKIKRHKLQLDIYLYSVGSYEMSVPQSILLGLQMTVSHHPLMAGF